MFFFFFFFVVFFFQHMTLLFLFLSFDSSCANKAIIQLPFEL